MDNLNKNINKFCDQNLTLEGKDRAHVLLKSLETLWFNTGTLCNLECINCYIESSPKNDALVYISHEEVLSYLNEINENDIIVREIGLTGGEPFMNPDILKIIESVLKRDFKLLILTNAMKPMMRHKNKLIEFNKNYPNLLSLRVSTDHYTKKIHQKERGDGSWDPMVLGLSWLSDNNFNIHVAGRTFMLEDERMLREGYADLFGILNIKVDAKDPCSLLLFPEMDVKEDVAEITTECWGILNVNPDDMMCATSRMIVKHKDAKHPVIMACTLLAFDQQFNMGTNLSTSKRKVYLNHPFCSTFCVLGGASCSN